VLLLVIFAAYWVNMNLIAALGLRHIFHEL